MVRVTGSKKLELYVIHDIIPRDEAEKRIEHHKKKAFGMFSSLTGMFSKNNHVIMVNRYLRRYEPFWVMEGESLLEYKRKTSYDIAVKPEVRSVKISGREFDVDEAQPVLTIDGEDHCFESYTKSIIKNAIGGSDKKLESYRKAPTHRIKSIKELQKDDSVVMEPTVKASYLIRDLIKDLIHPFDADIVIQERVHIKTTSLLFRPIHVFELKQGDKIATLEVNGITGAVTKSSPFKHQIAKKLLEEQTWFDVGTELASAIVPGAGASVVIGKHIKDRVAQKKTLKAMKSSQAARLRIKK